MKTTYIARDKQTKETLRTSETPFAIDDEGNAITPASLDANIEIITIHQTERPAYNSEESKTEPVESEEKGVITKSFNVIPLSKEELDAIDKQKADTLGRLSLLEALKAGEGTDAERIARCERVLARIAGEMH